ncbi:beta-lactamase/transpeptidase-like protein [Cercophora newfieldiana]|uniref:Beta-lactamase/transpeptidase-like protein n=1 Tax=Cercophora newfieldiana TaxID=92897 RepID=A0AA40CMS3_9PEZI|nr:beta-lactamase/transpeptidase-like protein [Cercophora newfieldiana]
MANDNIESAFEAAIAAGKINGAIICATDISGSFTYNRALGSRTLLSGEKRPQAFDDMLYLASATKLIATISALQKVDDGLLTLSGPIPEGLAPELSSKQVLTGFSDDGTPILVPASRPITLEMLLSHTSGVAYDFLAPDLAKWRAQSEQPLAEGARRPVEEAFSYPLAFQPGEGWMYGPGLDWAGRIVERLVGGTLGEEVRRRICKPLGIPEDDAQFYPVKGESVRARLVDLNPDDTECVGRAVLGGGGEMNLRSQGDFGGHGLFMTAPGYLEVLKSLLVNDGKLLKRETVEDMFRNRIRPEAEERHRAAMEGPMGPFYRVGTEPGSKVGYGLGGLLPLESTEGWYSDETLTWGGGLTFSWFVDRKNGLCGLAAVQASLPVDVKVVSDLKQTFRYDIYRKYGAWKERT